MSEPIDAIRDAAYRTRAQYAAGEITWKEARAELAPYIAAFNAKSEELAAKYHQKPQRLRVGEFLRNAP